MPPHLKLATIQKSKSKLIPCLRLSKCGPIHHPAKRALIIWTQSCLWKGRMMSMALPYNRLMQVLMVGLQPQLQWFGWTFWTTTVMKTIPVSIASGYMVNHNESSGWPRNVVMVYIIRVYYWGQGVCTPIVFGVLLWRYQNKHVISSPKCSNMPHMLRSSRTRIHLSPFPSNAFS